MPPEDVQKLQYDRVGYCNAFNAISAKVQNGARNLKAFLP